MFKSSWCLLAWICCDFVSSEGGSCKDSDSSAHHGAGGGDGAREWAPFVLFRDPGARSCRPASSDVGVGEGRLDLRVPGAKVNWVPRDVSPKGSSGPLTLDQSATGRELGRSSLLSNIVSLASDVPILVNISLVLACEVVRNGRERAGGSIVDDSGSEMVLILNAAHVGPGHQHAHVLFTGLDAHFLLHLGGVAIAGCVPVCLAQEAEVVVHHVARLLGPAHAELGGADFGVIRAQHVVLGPLPAIGVLDGGHPRGFRSQSAACKERSRKNGFHSS